MELLRYWCRLTANAVTVRLTLITWLAVAAVVVAAAAVAGQNQPVSIAEDYCQDEVFLARCRRPEDVILMRTARYGRPRLGRCVRRNLGYLGCVVDALPALDWHCSGRPAGSGCRLSVMDWTLRRLIPCPIDVTWHLEVSYECVEVQTVRLHDCYTRRRVQVTTSGSDPSSRHRSGLDGSGSSGYLSSYVATHTGLGSHICPWHIRAPAGQRITLSLYSFLPPVQVRPTSTSTKSDTEEVFDDSSSLTAGGPAASTGGSRTSGGSDESCRHVAIIRERGSTVQLKVTACRDDRRHRTIYVSASNHVEVEFVTSSAKAAPSASGGGSAVTSLSSALYGHTAAAAAAADEIRSLIHYQFIGCANEPLVPGATLYRDEDQLTIRCNTSDETWYLTCSGSEWTGSYGNCSNVDSAAIASAAAAASSNEDLEDDDDDDEKDDVSPTPAFPLAILVVVAVGVSTGLFIGGGLLLLANVVIKRNRTTSSVNNSPLSTDANDPASLFQYNFSSQVSATDPSNSYCVHRPVSDWYQLTTFVPPPPEMTPSTVPCSQLNMCPVAARKEYLFDIPVTLDAADKRRMVGGTDEVDKRRRILVDFDDVIGNCEAERTEISAAAATTEVSISTAGESAGSTVADAGSKFLRKTNRCSHPLQLQQQQQQQLQSDGQCLT